VFTSVLSDEQIRRLDQASLSILHRTGVRVPHEDVLRRFADAGADVDLPRHRVRIPPALVASCLGRAGRQFTIYGRDLSRTARFGQGVRNYNSIAGEAMWVDEVGADRRYARLADVATACRFADGLERINVVGAMTDAQDVPVAWRCVAQLAEMIRHTTKPLHFWLHDRRSAKYLLEMTGALRGGDRAAAEQPLWYAFLEPISPLRFPFNGVDLLFETSRQNIPVSVGPMAQMGVSAPCTVAGTLAMENAEILAGICIVQLIAPGTPVCYGGICHAFDMRTTQLIFCGPEQAIFGVAMTQMGKHYGLPVYINVGLTDSKRPDAQAGLEAAATLAMGAAAGADIFGHMGICGVDQATSLDMLVLQHEVVRYVEGLLREIDFSDETMGLDEIDAAGPGGTFLDREHTARHYRRELWDPRLLDRRFYQAWKDGGATDTEDRCRQEKQRILREHRVPPVEPSLSAEMDRVVSAARRELTQEG